MRILTENGENENVLSMSLWGAVRSEEHTSELQSRLHLVCRLLLEKKNSMRNLCRGRMAPIWSCFITPAQTSCMYRDRAFDIATRIEIRFPELLHRASG